MSLNLDNVYLKPGEREELEGLFAGTERMVEDMERDPELARQFLERVGYFKIMEDQQEEEARNNGASNNGVGHTRDHIPS